MHHTAMLLVLVVGADSPAYQRHAPILIQGRKTSAGKPLAKDFLCRLVFLSPYLLVLHTSGDGTSVAAAAEPLAVSATTSVHLTFRFSLSPVSPGYIPGGPQLTSYRPADTPSGFPWVYPRGTTTDQLQLASYNRPAPSG